MEKKNVNLFALVVANIANILKKIIEKLMRNIVFYKVKRNHKWINEFISSDVQREIIPYARIFLATIYNNRF